MKLRELSLRSRSSSWVMGLAPLPCPLLAGLGAAAAWNGDMSAGLWGLPRSSVPEGRREGPCSAPAAALRPLGPAARGRARPRPRVLRYVTGGTRALGEAGVEASRKTGPSL